MSCFELQPTCLHSGYDLSRYVTDEEGLVGEGLQQESHSPTPWLQCSIELWCSGSSCTTMEPRELAEAAAALARRASAILARAAASGDSSAAGGRGSC